MAGHPGSALTSSVEVVLRVIDCRRCGAWLDPASGSDLCEDCEPSDCAFCGGTVPRMDLTRQLACPSCVGEEP